MHVGLHVEPTWVSSQAQSGEFWDDHAWMHQYSKVLVENYMYMYNVRKCTYVSVRPSLDCIQGCC